MHVIYVFLQCSNAFLQCSNEKCNHYYQNERCSIMARVNAKTIHTVRHVYMATMTVLLMLQTQHSILTVSLPADLQPLPNKSTLSFCDPIHKNSITSCALSIGKKKNIAHFAPGGSAGLTIVANVAIATRPELLGAPRSSV